MAMELFIAKHSVMIMSDNKQQQALQRIIGRLAEYLIIADLLDCQCRAVHIPRSAQTRHTLFTSSLRRARMPLHDLVAQVRHRTAESRCPDVYSQKVRQAVLTFKRRITALQRIVPRGASPDLSELLLSAHTVTRRIKNRSDNLSAWIADHSKWWNVNKSAQ